jgi:uncharacterized protein
VRLDLLTGSYTICRLSADAPVPAWASLGTFSSITRTAHELSVVCESDGVPADVHAQRDYRGLVVCGPLDFDLVGVLAALATPLAGASVSIFVVSTFDTDYLFVRDANLDRAVAVLRAAGHSVTTAAGTA